MICMGKHGTMMDNDGQSMSHSNEPNPALKFQKPAKKTGHQPGHIGQYRAMIGQSIIR
jgi:hypothetical protein